VLKTFKIGGIHPPENKLTSGGKIQKLPVPEQVIIPLGQHIGAPASPVVKKGDAVKAGQLIGQATGFVSANVHSSVSGTVTAVESRPDAAGLLKPCIVIQVEGDEWVPEVDLSEKIERHTDLPKEEIIKAISAGTLNLTASGLKSFKTASFKLIKPTKIIKKEMPKPVIYSKRP